jgi:hypothetical protein
MWVAMKAEETAGKKGGGAGRLRIKKDSRRRGGGITSRLRRRQGLPDCRWRVQGIVSA